jgi:exo-poly-alpha-galacturonosidase
MVFDNGSQVWEKRRNDWMKKAKYLSLMLAVVCTFSSVFGFALPVEKAFAAAIVQAPQNVQVPALAYDEKSITLVWEKPAVYDNVVNYNIYMDGKLVGTAYDNKTSPAKPYMDKFYADSSNQDAQRITMHNYTATGLKPNTTYKFTVRAIDKAGNESPQSKVVTQVTTAVPKAFNIVDYGAVGDGTTSNTKAIQAAIDACTTGGKVIVPAGVFKTGAIWLKSNMTLEISKDATLLATENAAEYVYGNLPYMYSTDTRFYSLINAHTFDFGSMSNIRIVGEGTIDGNGWKQIGVDKEDPSLPVYASPLNAAGQSDLKEVLNIGITAKTTVERAVGMGMTMKSVYPRRPSLVNFRGVNNVYYNGITVINPANHTLMNANCNNVTVNGVIFKTYDCNNGDGIEFSHGSGLIVFNNFFDTGDDGMNFAAGQGAVGNKEEPTQNAWIFNNYFRHGHGAIVTGSHTAAWLQNILAEDNIMNGVDVGLRCKTNGPTGGGARNIVFRDNALKNIQLQGFIFTSAYSDPNAVMEFEPAAEPGRFKDITVQNCTVDGTGKASIEVAGNANGYHENINFENIRFLHAKPALLDYMKNSSFKHVVFDNTEEPWKITNSTGLSFDKKTTQNSASLDAESAPVWSAASSVTAGEIGETSVVVSWSGAIDNAAVAKYNILADDIVVATVAGSEVSKKITGFAPGETYKLKVEAIDATGNVTTTGPSLIVTTMGTKSTEPPTVSTDSDSVKLANIGTTWVNLTWKPATSQYGIKQYVVYVNDKQVAVLDSKVKSYNIGGLTANEKYTFKVKAIDVSGNETVYSVQPEGTTKPLYDLGAPKWAAKSSITANVTSTSVTLSWSAATDDKAVVGYRVYKDGNAISPNGESMNTANPVYTVNDTTFAITGLSPNTKYTFKIEAGDAMGRWTGTGPSITVTTSK